MDGSNSLSGSAPVADWPVGARSTDVGGATARNYRYQHAYGVMLLAAAWRGERPYVAIWCEHHEDFLAERGDGRFDAFQIKTRKPELGAWTLTTAELVHALKRFSDLAAAFGDRLHALYFVSNAAFAIAPAETKDQQRYARCPETFLSHLRGCASPSEIASPFAEAFEQLARDCGCRPEDLLRMLKKVDLIVGPSRGEFDAALAHEHLARLKEHAGLSALALDDLRDDLVALVGRAASLHVTNPERHLRGLVSPETADPALAAKRIAVDVVAKSRPYSAETSRGRGLEALHGKVDLLLENIAASGSGQGLNRAQVLSLLKAFSEENLSETEAVPLLLQKAEELRQLKQTLEARATADVENRELLEVVLRALEAGDYKQADDVLERLIASGAADRAAALENTVRLYCTRAALAHAQLQYDVAADHFGTAAGVAMAFDKGWAFSILGAQVQALVDHARMRPGLAAFHLAIQICARRGAMAEKGTQPHLDAAIQLVSTIGVYSERAAPQEAAVALESALAIGRTMLSDINPTDNTEDWLCLASNFGAALNNAARLATGDKFDTISAEAVAVLAQASEVAQQHGRCDQRNIETNLATAFRLRAKVSASPQVELLKAISHRLRALELGAPKSTVELGNAYDSLGNDYTAVATLGPALDRISFRRAMAAYRRALRHRVRSISPINWARTQFNIANAHAAAASLSSASEARKLWTTALFRLDWAFTELDAKGAPHDWTNASLHQASIVATMLDDDHAVDEARIEESIRRLADVGDFADRTYELELVFRALDLQGALNTRIYMRRLPEAARIFEFEKERLQPRRVGYRDTGASTLLEITDAQLEIMLAHLYSDRARAEKACEAAQACRTLADKFGPDWLPTQIDQIVIEMKSVVEELSA